MNLSDQQQLFAKDVMQLLKFIFTSGYNVTFGDAYRAPELAELYAKEGKGIVHSLHCQRLAIDLNLFSPEGQYITTVGEFKKFGEYWESLDKANRWGGHFPPPSRIDPDHFERRME